MKIMNISSELHSKVLVCIVERDDQVFIPSGSFRLHSNDIISIVASHKNAIDFFQKIGIFVESSKNVMLIGGSTLTVYLAKRLLTQTLR